MALSKSPPNTILLGGGLPGGDQAGTKVNEYVGSATITPGMLIEQHSDAGKLKWRPNSSATNVVTPVVALEKSLHNKTVDDTYAAGELILAYHLRKGSTWWALLPSGQNITTGDYLQSNGDGMLKEATSVTAGDNVAQFQALETLGAITVTTRCRVVVL